jgi:putative oxidoreductase
MLTRILRTPDEKSLAIVRGLLGLLFFVRGAQGLLGWFGGSGIHDLNSFFRLVNLSAPLVFLAVFIDFLAGIGLIAGLFTRIAAACILADTASTLALWAINPRVFLDWSITQGGASIEYYLLAFVVALILVVRGAGAFSFDRILLGRSFRRAGLRIASASAGLDGMRPNGRSARSPRLPRPDPAVKPHAIFEGKQRVQ